MTRKAWTAPVGALRRRTLFICTKPTALEPAESAREIRAVPGQFRELGDRLRLRGRILRRDSLAPCDRWTNEIDAVSASSAQNGLVIQGVPLQ